MRGLQQRGAPSHEDELLGPCQHIPTRQPCLYEENQPLELELHVSVVKSTHIRGHLCDRIVIKMRSNGYESAEGLEGPARACVCQPGSLEPVSTREELYPGTSLALTISPRPVLRRRAYCCHRTFDFQFSLLRRQNGYAVKVVLSGAAEREGWDVENRRSQPVSNP